MSNGSSGQSKLHFHFVKSSVFRVIYAEGVFGGVSPKGQIRMSLFNERFPLPQETVHEVLQNSEGGIMLGNEVTTDRVSKSGIIRELEADIVLSYETAKIVHQWMGERIEEMESITKKGNARHEKQ